MTFKVAELLTKQWLMGVRKGWLSLLNPGHLNGWPAIFKAIGRLRGFVDNLQEQVIFVRRGPQTSTSTTPEGQELLKLFKVLRDAISDQLSKAKHWHDAENQDEHWMGRGSFTREQGEEMRRRYETDLGSHMTTYVKTRANPSKGTWLRQREAGLTEVLDKILEVLRVDVKRLEETMQLEEEHGIAPTREVFSEPTFNEFSMGRMKIIVLDPNIDGSHLREYVRYFDKAHALIQKSGLSKLWYGVMLLDSKEYKKLSPEELKAYRDYGYETLEQSAGTFHSGDDTVRLTAPPGSDITRVVIHELGHRYWYKFMRAPQRARFNSLIQTNPTEKFRDYPSGQLEDGVRKPVAPVSTYGASTIEEAFAEAFERYVRKRDMGRDQLESLRSVLASKMHERVAQRFYRAMNKL